jgi:hypothetical protein
MKMRKRDFLKMSLDVISYTIDIATDEDFSDVQKMIESIDYCGLCSEAETKVRKRCGC